MAIYAESCYPEEEWAIISDYPNYSVSNFENVKNNLKNKLLHLNKSSVKYFVVSLCNKGEVKQFSVHRLVAKHFVGKTDEFNVVNHLDADRNNNYYENLEWTTNDGNIKHYHSIFSKQKAEGSAKAKIKNKDAILIRQLYEIHKNAREVSRITGIKYSICYRVSSGETFKSIF